MTYNSSQTLTNATERDFVDFMQRGDDFYKIELLRQAKSWYLKALGLHTDNETVKTQIAACDRLLAYERKVVRILLIIASVGVLIYFLVIK